MSERDDHDAEDRHLALGFPQKPIEVVRAYGAEFDTSDGRLLIDLGGASHGVANFGHAHPRVTAAIAAQAERIVHAVATVRSPERARFLEVLHALLPPHLGRSHLVNSGAEATEAALKYAHAATGRSGLVAARGGFHGRTLGALATCHRPAYRKPFEDVLRECVFVPYDAVASLAAAVDETTAAILLEPVQGEGGVQVPSPGYLEAAASIARERGALLVIDEIQTGLGRTGYDLAIQASAVEPDILLLGKSLAGGLPIGLAAMREEIAAALPPGGHGSTFGGAPLVAAAAAESLGVLAEEALAERAEAEGEWLLERLQGLDQTLIREVRGRGLMIGVDLRCRVGPVLTGLLARGFLALPAGATVLRLLPPLTIDRAALDAAVDALAEVLTDLAGQAEVA